MVKNNLSFSHFIFFLQLPFTSTQLKGMWDYIRGTCGSLVYFCAVLHHYAGLVRVTCLFSG